MRTRAAFAFALALLVLTMCASCGGGGGGGGSAGDGSPAPVAERQTVQITWRGGDDVAGYVVHWGTASRVYVHDLDVQKPLPDATGDLTVAIALDAIDTATTYYFAVTSYDAAHIESAYSNELSVDVGG